MDDRLIAPDVSVFPAEPDPATGGRRLEEIAIEMLDTERLSHATMKAEKFVVRGGGGYCAFVSPTAPCGAGLREPADAGRVV